MSAKVTDASRRRMAEVEHFVHLQPGPYCEIVGKQDGLPRVRITIEGRPQTQEFANELIDALRDYLGERCMALKLVTRGTA